MASRVAPRAPRAPRAAPRCARTARTTTPRAAAATAAPGADAGVAPLPVTFPCACPLCHATPFPVTHAGPGTLSPPRCPSCGRSFAADATFLDLTPAAGAPTSGGDRYWTGTELFRSPLVAAAYDRGWRAGFAWAGFPGADAEFDTASAWLAAAPAVDGSRGPLLDLSCGSGLFSRRFAASPLFDGVIAADYSESMLRTAAAGLQADGVPAGRYLPLRVDAGRLPFANGSLAAVHAGAALHCWPAPGLAVAEVGRVLKPGGVFVASTFLNGAAPLGSILGDSAAAKITRYIPGTVPSTNGAYRWWSEDELRDVCAAAGLVDFRRWRRNRFIMFSVRKPAPTTR